MKKLASTIQDYAPASWEYEYVNESCDYCATLGHQKEYYIPLQFSLSQFEIFFKSVHFCDFVLHPSFSGCRLCTI
jgi:hypothetical protein